MVTRAKSRDVRVRRCDSGSVGWWTTDDVQKSSQPVPEPSPRGQFPGRDGNQVLHDVERRLLCCRSGSWHNESIVCEALKVVIAGIEG